MDSFVKMNIDILQPPLLSLGNRNYRVLTPSNDFSTGTYTEDDLYPEDEQYKDEPDCAFEEESNIEITITSNRKMKCELEIASVYFPSLIGHRGGIKHRIEHDTHTNIRIPHKGMQGNVVITGNTHREVRQAAMQVLVLLDQAKRRQPFTHFLSIPFTGHEIQDKFALFKKDVLEKCCSSRGVDSSLFQTPEKLHMTLCVCVLSDERERQQAIHALEKANAEVLEELSMGAEAMRLQIKGVEYMNDDPAEVDVLYGKVSSISWSQDLQTFSDSLVNKLHKAGVISKQYDSVKLHITLMNTLFRKGSDYTDTTHDKPTKRETFDARQILEEYRDFDFGEVEMKEVHLSVRYTTAANGYYKSSTKLSMIN